MKRFFLLFFLFSASLWSQTETELIKKYSPDFEKADKFLIDNSVSVEASIIHFNSLIQSLKKK